MLISVDDDVDDDVDVDVDIEVLAVAVVSLDGENCTRYE